MPTSLRSREGRSDPAVGTVVVDSLVIQGHRLRLATVDLTASYAGLRARLIRLPTLDSHFSTPSLPPVVPHLWCVLTDLGCGSAFVELRLLDLAGARAFFTSSPQPLLKMEE